MANKVTDPRLDVFLDGRGQVTNTNYTSYFAIEGKGENTLKFKDTDGSVDLMLTSANIGIIQKVIMLITPTVVSTADPEVVVTLTLNSGGPDYTVDLGCSRFFMWEPSLTYAGYLKNITISTTSTDYIKVDVRIYGVAP